MLTADDCRRNAAAENDPLLLGAQDKIRYAELLIRFHDHPVLSSHYQFWGNLAGYLNRIAALPDQPRRQNLRAWNEFNTAQAMASGYIKMSPASAEIKTGLLTRYFPPAPQDQHEQEGES